MNLTRRHFLQTTTATFALSALGHRLLAADAPEADICVYGATASGVAAAIGAANAGAKVIVVKPSHWLNALRQASRFCGRRWSIGNWFPCRTWCY